MRALNEAVLDEKFPLLTVEELQCQLSGSTVFPVLDLKNAFHHVKLHKDSRDLTTFVTPRGVYRYKVLMFGLKSASEIFQKIMIQHVLKDLKGVALYIDDIIIYAKTREEHDEILRQLMKRPAAFNIQLNELKCQVGLPEVRFIGHVVTADGIKPAPEKVDLVRKFKQPENKEQLRSFLGLVNYVMSRQQTGDAEASQLLRKLTLSDQPFEWTVAHRDAFNTLRESMDKIISLSYFCKKDRTLLFADASPTALGAVLGAK